MNEQYQQADDLFTLELAAKRSARERLKDDLDRLEAVARENSKPPPSAPFTPKEPQRRRQPWSRR